MPDWMYAHSLPLDMHPEDCMCGGCLSENIEDNGGTKDELIRTLKAPFKKQLKAYKVTCGISVIHCETMDDVELVCQQFHFGFFATGKQSPIEIVQVEIDEIPEKDRLYIEWLRD